MRRTCDKHGAYAHDMKMVQIRNVPEDLVNELKARAAARRQSLSDFLLEELAGIVETPPLDDVLDRLATAPRRNLGVSASELLDEVRGQ